MHASLPAVLMTLLSASACVCLQAPCDVRMEAINTRYTLHWDWPGLGHNHTYCFTVHYKYSHEPTWDSNSGVCEGVCGRSCDLSRHLSFSGSYLLRVRAESGGQRSNWSHTLKFTPDEDTLLGQPSSVELQGGVSMVTVQMMEPLTHDGRPMSSLIEDLTYRVQYWETHTHTQTCETRFPLLVLRDLKPHTEYCLRVCVFSLYFDKTSNYTHTQCTHTHGRHAWGQVALGVCAGVCVTCVLVLVTATHSLRKKREKQLIPCSLQTPPLSHRLPLLLLGQEHCSEVAVEEPVAMATQEAEEDREMGEEPPSVCEDSGVYSAEDSSDSSVSSQLHTHTHTHTHCRSLADLSTASRS